LHAPPRFSRQVFLLALLAALGTTAAYAAASDPQSTPAQCNPVPAVNWLIAEPVGRTPQEFLALLESDPTFRALFSGVAIRAGPPPTLIIAFPELEDPTAVIVRLPPGQLQSVRWPIGEIVCPLAPDRLAPVVEYYNTRLDHYFQTADPGEQAAIDQGDVGADWVRTGESFLATLPSCAARAYSSGLAGVYRFFGVPGIGPNSHFFTASPLECAIVEAKYPGWAFEGTAFWVSPAAGDTCAPPSKPVYRLYNNGKGGEPNHRYTIDLDVVATMIASGWVLEGAAWCADSVNGP
jgi:uncharacterized protein DUF5648